MSNRPIAYIRVNDLALYVDVRDLGVGLPLYLERRYEPAETAFFRRVLRPGMVVADIGANIGYFTNLIAKTIGSTGQVIAFEPDPHNFALLDKTTRANGFKNIRLENLALGSTSGTAHLFRAPSNYGDHQLFDAGGSSRKTVSVAIDTLDNVLARHELSHVDVVKMDIQGYEAHALNGMHTLLDSTRAMILLTEISPYHLIKAGASPSEYIDTLHGFRLSAALLSDDGSELPIERGTLQAAVSQLDFSDSGSHINVVFRR